MNVLLHSVGNATARFVCVAAYPENYARGKLGDHDVLTFGFNEGVDVRIRPEDDFSEVMRRLPEGWVPDLCILWNVEWCLLPEGIEDSPFPIVLVEMDWDYDIPLSRNIVQSTDLVITIGEFERQSILSLGAKDCQIFYSQGIMKEYVSDKPLKISERPYDIYYSTLIIDDTAHPDRSNWILKLCSLANKYKVFIGANPDHNGYIEDLRKAKLVFSYHRYGSMSSRFLDAGGQGAIVVEPGYEVKKSFEPDKEYVPVNEDNIIRQIDVYLRDEERLQEMSDRVYEKVVKDYEARDRFLGLIEFSSDHLKNKGLSLSRPFQKLSEAEKALRRGEVYYYSCYRANVKDFFVNIDIDYLLKLSIEEFRKAVSIDPCPRAMTALSVALISYEGFLLNLGKTDIAEEKGREALSIIEKVISLYPSYVMAWFNLGLIHFRKGNCEQAESIFRQALELFKDRSSDLDPWVLHNRDFELFDKLLRKPLNQNLLLFCKGEKEKAVENIRRLYQAALLYFLSILEERKGRIYESLENLIESYNLYPECGVIAKEVAQKLALLGFKNDAVRLYKESISLLPLDIDLRIEYITLLYLYKMDKEAMKEIKEVFKICKTVTPLSSKLSVLNNTIRRFDRFDSSSCFSHDSAKESILNDWIETLYNWLKKNPRDIRIVLRLIGLYSELKRIDKAVELIEDYLRQYKDNLTIEEVTAIRDTFQTIQDALKRNKHYLQGKMERLKISNNGVDENEAIQYKC